MPLRQGDVVLITFPFSDLSGQKLRPALILSATPHLRRGRDVIVIPLTTQAGRGPEWLRITQQELREGKLKRTSHLRLDRITGLSQSLIRFRVGSVNTALLKTVVERLNRLIVVA